MSKGPLAYLHALHASQGARARQEDHALVWQPETLDKDAQSYPLLAVLADGMGGHVSGQIASQIACAEFVQAFSADSGDLGPRMARALDAANAGISKKISDEPDHEGMGCTLVAAYLDDDGLRWVSVGDSALLMLREGRLHRLNADHSHGAVLDKQAAEGIISKEAAESDTRRRALRSALTGDRIPLQEIHAQALELQVGDKLIVASDGLLTLSGDEIADLTEQGDLKTPEALAEDLVAKVIDKNMPRQDNTTVVVVGVDESDGRPPVISTPISTSTTGPVSTSPAPATSKSEPRILGLRLPYFILSVIVVFLIGFFAV